MSNKNCTNAQYQWLSKESQDWVKQGLLGADEQKQILSEYQLPGAESSQSHWSNVLLISLGAVLIGGGVILLLAHNWEDFGKGTRTLLSFLPLVLAQVLCWFAIQYRPQSLALRESGGTLLFFAVAASIALISQTYHIYGDLERFLVVWLALGIPIAYLMRSATTLMLASILIVWLCCLEREPYWLLYVTLIPYFYQLHKRQSRFLLPWALWLALIGLSISVVYASSYYQSPLHDRGVYIALALGCAYYCLGYWLFGIEEERFWANPPTSFGILLIGGVGLGLTWLGNSSIYSLWNTDKALQLNDYLILCLVGLSIVGTMVFIVRTYKDFLMSHWVALTSFILALLGVSGLDTLIHDNIMVSFANLYILIGSVLLMFQGINQQRLLLLNGGLIWFSLLVLFRYFDSDIPFVLKGVIFIVIGIAFIVTNVWFRKKQSLAEAEEGV